MSKKNTPNQLSDHETTKKKYLVATKRGSLATQSGLKPLTSFDLKNHLQRFPNTTIKRTINRNSSFSPQSIVPGEAKEIYVVEMDLNTHKEFCENSPEHLLIEEEQPLDFLDSAAQPNIPTRGNSLRNIAESNSFNICVLGEKDVPLEGVNISIQSQLGNESATTDTNGNVTITLETLPSSPVDSIFAKAKSSYWDFYLKSPALKLNQPNIIRLKSLSETLPEFPKSFQRGWGENIMGFNGNNNNLKGKGARIAIIDTGMGDHTLLEHVSSGIDLTNNGDRATWTDDQEGHGTHVCGVITANGQDNSFSGFCPEADVLIIKVFPGGSTSALVEALDICIAERIDVVNMSLGTQSISQIVEQKIEEAVMAGVALIVAAGNSGGSVQFPACSANTLAVSAIGSTAMVQPNTFDASQISPLLTKNNGIFSPLFSCYGPEVDVTAPGVSIISTGPNNTFFPDSGTSMAAPHITGLAALLIAHHPFFFTPNRNFQRVFTLYDLLRNICIPLDFGPGRAGSGLPCIDPIAHQLK